MAPRSQQQVYQSQFTVPVIEGPRAQRVDVSSGVMAVGETLEQIEERTTSDATLKFTLGMKQLRAETDAKPWNERKAFFDAGVTRLKAETEKGLGFLARNNPMIHGRTMQRVGVLAEVEGIDVKAGVEKGRRAHNVTTLEGQIEEFGRNAALATTPAQTDFWHGQIGEAVASARLSESINDDEAALYLKNVQRNTDLTKAMRLIDQDPHAAVEVLATDGNFKSLTGLQIVKLREDAEREAERRDAKALADEAARGSVVASDLQVKINRFSNAQGDFSQADLEQVRGTLRPEVFDRLQIQFDDARARRSAAVQEQTNVAQLIEQGGHIDPANKAQLKAYDAHFRDTVLPQIQAATEGLSPEQRGEAINARILDFIRGQGVVPETIKANIRTALRSGSTEQKIEAARTLDQVKAVNPQALDDFSDGDIRFGNAVSAYVDAGATPQEAVRLTTEALRRPKGETKVLEANYELETKDDRTSDWLGYQMSDWWSRPGVSVVVAAEVDRTVQSEYVRNGGNLEAARRTALDMTKRRYGPTTVNGTWEVVRNPIERHYSVPWKTPEENATAIKEEAVRDIATGGATDGPMTPDTVRILPYPVKGVTNPDGKPVYAIEVQDSAGGWTTQIDENPQSQTFGMPKPWWPSLGKVRDERKKEIEQKIDDAKKKRSAWQGKGGPLGTPQELAYRETLREAEPDGVSGPAYAASPADTGAAHSDFVVSARPTGTSDPHNPTTAEAKAFLVELSRKSARGRAQALKNVAQNEALRREIVRLMESPMPADYPTGYRGKIISYLRGFDPSY